MRVCVLGSGSRGNCTLVQSGGTALVIDAGFSGVEIKRRLAAIGCQPEIIGQVLVTHEHNDHVAGVGVLSRRLGIPVYANQATHRAAEQKVGRVYERREFETGEGFVIGDLQVHPFAVSHDTSDPVGFVIADGTTKVGYCTDTGKVTKLIEHHLRQCQALVLESNHDPQMLREGPYPPRLQQRVLSNRGHLANEDAGRLLARLAGPNLTHVILAHLSETNNLPDLALACTRRYLDGHADRLTLVTAFQDSPSVCIDLT